MDKLNVLTVEDALLDISMDDRGEWFAEMNIRFGIDKREIVRMCAREPIVRCRDCRCKHDVDGRHLCVRWQFATEPDGFCAWGERKVEHERD